MKKALFCLSLLFVFLSLNAMEYKVGLADKFASDGFVAEAAWQPVTSAGNFSRLKAAGKNASALKSSFKVLADAENIYFNIICEDPEPDKVRANLSGAHSNPWANDLVEIFLAPTGYGDEFYQFVISAGGAYWQEFYGERGNIKPDPFSPVYDIKTIKRSDGWGLEIKIPFSALYMTSANAWKNTWLANVIRYSPQRGENSSWSKLVNNNHESDAFNKFTAMPTKPLAFDLRVNSATFKTREAAADGFIGTLETEILLLDAPAGNYSLLCNEQSSKLNLKKGTNLLSSRIKLPLAGKNMVKYVLQNEQGKIVHERFYPVIVDSSPLKMFFTAPQYGGNFYPGEASNRLKGYIEVSTADKSVDLTINGNIQKLQILDGKAEFDIDISKITGDIQVECSDIKKTIKRIKDAKAWIRNGKIIVNGKNEFLLGWYGGPGWIGSKAFNEKYPRRRDKHPVNMHGWITLEPARLLGKSIEAEAISDQMPSEKMFDAIKKAIEKNIDSKHFVYYLSDEPECRGLSPVYLRHLYEYIKKLDPGRLVMIISRAPVIYIDCADIINPHPYIGPTVNEKGERNLNQSIAQLRDMCASVERLQRKDKALMLTPQTFSYAINNFYADFPTFDETNASIWASVCCGGQGITPYIWYDHAARPGLRYGCDFIYFSLDRLAKYLYSEDSERLGEQDIRVFRHKGKSLYLLVNVLQEEQEFNFSTKARRLQRFRDTGSIKPKRGQVQLKLAPYEVVILSEEKLDSGLESITSLREKIAAAEKARSERGNILFGKGREIELSSPPSSPYDLQKSLEQQDKMFDGVLDVSAWMPRRIKDDSLWYEMAFTTFVPEFSKAQIHGWNLEGLTFKIWKFGKWLTPEVEITQDKYRLELDFGKTLRTVKIRLEFAEKEAELYEFELFE